MNSRAQLSSNDRTLVAMEKLQRITARWLTANEQELILRANEKSNKNADAAILWTLYRDFGFTAEQLLQFYNTIKTEYASLGTYDMATADLPIVSSLCALGVDLTALYEEE